MKKLLNKKLIIPALLLVLVFVIVILYWLGFRITYAPELENSWEAVSAVAAWAGVVVSFVAIWFAVQVPKKIAEQQNKIALFEKRLEFYLTLKKLESISVSMNNLKEPINNKSIQNVFVLTFTQEPKLYVEYDRDGIYDKTAKYLIEIKSILDAGPFLFSLDMKKYIIEIIQNLVELLYYSDQTGIEDKIKIYKENIENIKDDILPLVENELDLTNMRM